MMIVECLRVRSEKEREGEARIGIKIRGNGGRGKGWIGDENEINRQLGWTCVSIIFEIIKFMIK